MCVRLLFLRCLPTAGSRTRHVSHASIHTFTRIPTHECAQHCRAGMDVLWETRREELSVEGVLGEVDFCRRMLAYLDERLRSVLFSSLCVCV